MLLCFVIEVLSITQLCQVILATYLPNIFINISSDLQKKITTKGVHMQIIKQTTNKTIIDHYSTKTSLDSTWYGRRLRQKTSWKSSGKLHGSRLDTTSFKSLGRLPGSTGSLLAHYILEDFP